MLKALLQGAIEDADARQAKKPLEEVLEDAKKVPPALDVEKLLAPGKTVKVIAEVKRASPSRGDLAEIPDPAILAQTYETGGASVVSVLTEGRKFKGSLEDLESVRDRVKIAVLRKDFIGNEYQIAEARAAGADLVLLIVAALDEETLKRLYEFSVSLGMTPLVEAHTEEEVETAVALGAKLVGVNARNLRTFELDKDLFSRVQHLIPNDRIKIAESAVFTVEDVEHYRKAGADAVLIGEALATAEDPEGLLKQFLSV